ncbi:Iron-sulfur-binding reductase [Fulvivirga imtechensis AK7]|uniref:Iron-sulfur-binding reductase n=1 Tax=Fulvivirga imtechensis AK7 TaxID=1237149 RepID=L8JVV9_9BACT|nr:(Fe-S)-binding protein [Fulvivirga imtechensis]ELR72940.1 Iron-sulfur-binding reductase [Fulvivirga imtechensis AK7]
MEYLAQIVFILIVAVATYILVRRIRMIRKGILLGKDVKINDHKKDRWRNMLLIAFGQKKMFKRPIPAVLHLFLYGGFLIINIEVLEFVVDGFTGAHRAFTPYFGHVYPWMMNIFEFLAVAVLISCVIFLVRRNLLRVKRFHAYEMTQWPKLDANLILIIEITLMLAILTMNAADQHLQIRSPEHYPASGKLFFSSLLMPLFENMSTGSLIVVERTAWWFHIVGILGFAIYITYSKHLHIFMAFPNTYYSALSPQGQMKNMDAVTNEVNMMLGIQTEAVAAPPSEEIGRFGAKDVNDLTWKNLMDAYSCTECGRCTSECPANITGKLLSPRKIMMDTRDRAEEVVKNMGSGGKGLEDGKSLLHDYITKEEINACTSCQACVEACPVNINPLEIIYELKRYVAMEESGSPASWNSMFQNIETNFAPWKFAPTDRFNWANDLKAEKAEK